MTEQSFSYGEGWTSTKVLFSKIFDKFWLNAINSSSGASSGVYALPGAYGPNFGSKTCTWVSIALGGIDDLEQLDVTQCEIV
jgi:hypothetical protein